MQKKKNKQNVEIIKKNSANNSIQMLNNKTEEYGDH